MTAPRLELDLGKVERNARALVEQLAPRGIRVTGVTKAVLGAPEVAAAFERGGVTGFGDSRIENLAGLQRRGAGVPLTLIRSPMLSQVDAVVQLATTSLNSELVVIEALAAAARRCGVVHGVVLMVELGDLREGIAPDALVGLATQVEQLSGLHLAGVGTNLACQSGMAPDQMKMDELSAHAERVEGQLGRRLDIVSGGNSANLDWALTTDDVGRIDELRLGEAILLGTDPLHRAVIDGLHADACAFIGEVIEVQTKPVQPWGTAGQSAFGAPTPRSGTGMRVQALVAAGHHDVDPVGLTPPEGLTILGASSDHLVLDVGERPVAVGDELNFGVDYSALVRAMTSRFVTKRFGTGAPTADGQQPRTATS